MLRTLNFFKNKKVLISGHTGFKGAWLSFIMIQSGAKVMGISDKIQNKKLFKQLEIKKGIKNHEFLNIRNYKKLKNKFKSFKPEIIFHLAAQAIVSDSYKDPINTFSSNVMGSINILQSCIETKSVKSLIFVTSDKCYENNKWIWGYRENDKLGGNDPYSASKASAEIIFSSYLRSFIVKNKNFGAASVRAGNVIGGGDWSKNRLVPDIIRSLINAKPINIRNPKSVRPWQHVLEPLSGYILLAKKLYYKPQKFSGTWNFGPSNNDNMNVEQVVREFLNYFKKGKIVIDKSNNFGQEASLLKLNCDKANSILGWSAKWNTKETIKKVAEWYKFDENKKVEITKKQINEYYKQ
jgi:CDP-glucose 4,6-dehydratase